MQWLARSDNLGREVIYKTVILRSAVLQELVEQTVFRGHREGLADATLAIRRETSRRGDVTDAVGVSGAYSRAMITNFQIFG